MSGRFDGASGLVRGYLTSIGAGSGYNIVSNSYVSEMDSVFKNYLFRRFLSTGAPKKGSKICFRGVNSVVFFYDVLLIV